METNKLVLKEYLGTGKIAKLFNVAPRTVAKWIDNDMLRGSRIPGSKHRRVAKDEVVRFAKEYGIEIEEVGKTTEPPKSTIFDLPPKVEMANEDESVIFISRKEI